MRSPDCASKRAVRVCSCVCEEHIGPSCGRWNAVFRVIRQAGRSLVYGFSDPVAAAKVLSSFAKDNDKLIVKAGGMPNFVMDEKGVKQLATLPSRDELLAKLMATMQAPIGIRSHAERSAVAPGAYLGSHTRLEGCTRVTTSKNLNRYNAFS